MPIFCILYTKKCKVFCIFIEKSVKKCKVYTKKCKLYMSIYMSSGLRATAIARFPLANRHMRFLYGCLICLFAAYFSRKWSLKSVSPDRVPYAIFSCLFSLSATASIFPKLDKKNFL